MLRRGAVVVVVIAAVVAAVVAVRGCGADDAGVAPAPTVVAPAAARPAVPTQVVDHSARRERSVGKETDAKTTDDARPAVDPPAPRTGTGVVVEIVDAAGRPVDDALVGLASSDADPAGPRIEYFPGVQRMREAVDGKLVVDDLPKGLDGRTLEVWAVDGESSGAGSFVVRKGEKAALRLTLGAPRSMDVVVVDAADERPVEGAHVHVDAPPDSHGEGVTDASGQCVIRGLGAGVHDVVIDESRKHVDWRGKWRDGALVVRLPRIAPEGTVTVTVIGADHKPLAGATVTMVDPPSSRTTDRQGQAVFLCPAGGRTFAIWRVDDHEVPGEVVQDAVEVVDGGRHSLTLGFRAGLGALVGVVGLDDGTACPGLQVEIWGDGSYAATTDARGEARFDWLPFGRYLVRVRLSPDADWSFHMHEIKDGDPVRARWVLGRAVVKGRAIRRDGGSPVAGLLLRVAGPLYGGVTTDQDGSFTLSGAIAGAYRITSLGSFDKGRGVVLPATVSAPGPDVTLDVVDPGVVEVRFDPPDDERLQVMFVSIVDADGESVCGPTPRVKDGRIAASDVPPGTWHVDVALFGDREPRRYPVEVVSGKTCIVDVRLR